MQIGSACAAQEETNMEQHRKHSGQHTHQHDIGCGHTRVDHEDHFDYIHDGHLHRSHGDHVDECRIESDARNPSACTPDFVCPARTSGHLDAEQIPHGDHVDFLVVGHLHHVHGGHCDDHGAFGPL
jgi:hypothetical protein